MSSPADKPNHGTGHPGEHGKQEPKDDHNDQELWGAEARDGETLLMARTVSRCAAVTRLRLDFIEACFNLRGREAALRETTLGAQTRLNDAPVRAPESQLCAVM